MTRYNSATQACRRKSSSNYSRCSISETIICRAPSGNVSDKLWNFSLAISRAQRASARSPSRRATFLARLSASSQVGASTVAFSASRAQVSSVCGTAVFVPPPPQERMLQKNIGRSEKTQEEQGRTGKISFAFLSN
jgi:hypothetical protein